jgi:hypothetical protein
MTEEKTAAETAEAEAQKNIDLFLEDDDFSEEGSDAGKRADDDDDSGEGNAGNDGNAPDANKDKKPENQNQNAGNDSDLSDEELLKEFQTPSGDNKPAPPPTEFNSPIEVANYLGFEFKDKKPEEINFEVVKNEVEKYKKLASESDLVHVKNMKQFILDNPQATELDYFQKYVSPFEPLKYFGDAELLMLKFTEVDKLSKEDAQKKYDEFVVNGELEKEATKFRTLVAAKDKEFYDNLETEKTKQASIAEKEKTTKRQELMQALISSKADFLGGKIALKNNDIKSIYDSVVGGEVHKALKSHKVMGEVAWFLKNKEKFFDILEQNGENAEKVRQINEAANAKRQVNSGVTDTSTKDQFSEDDWNE